MGKLTISMAIINSYVCLPEGRKRCGFPQAIVSYSENDHNDLPLTVGFPHVNVYIFGIFAWIARVGDG